ncbi:MAG: hypothetical protein ACE5HC_02525 [Candidatus Binatia bacterium]
MSKKLLSLVLMTLFTLSVAGWLVAAEIKGKVVKIERDGRYITVKNPCKSVKIRISGSRTDLKGVDDRSDIKEGQSIKATYDADDDRKTASKVSVK